MTPPVDTLPTAASTRFPRPVRGELHQPEAPPRDSGLTADVVIVTRDSHTELARSLGAIRQAAARAGAGLLFVDLGSADHTRSFVARHAPGAQGIWLRADDGLADALSAAAACSEADVLVVLKPGLKPSSPEAITRLTSHLEEHPYAAAAAPMLRGQSGDVLPTAHPEPAHESFSRVECVLGDVIAIRRAEVVAAGEIRRRRSRSSDDLDLCLALRRRGREIHYLSSAEWRDASGMVAARVSENAAHIYGHAARLMWRRPGHALRLSGRRASTASWAARLGRVFDIVAAALLIVILAPVFLAIAIAIQLDSSGPSLFRQRRVGRDASHFEMFKFRTMFDKADPGLHEHFVRNMIVNRVRGEHQREAQVFKLHPDPRITRVGRFLRRTSLDELPQLLNILRGDMTFVGFRPPIPYEVSNYPAWYFRRFDSKPGLTGLWQVSGRNQCSYEEMVCLDIEYVNRRSWVLDLSVLLRTVGVVISGRGAY